MESGSIARLLHRLDVRPSESPGLSIGFESSLHTAFAFAPTPASYTLSTFPVPLSRPQGPQLACCPGIHATACADLSLLLPNCLQEGYTNRSMQPRV
jgi:hypothetical protein